MSGYLPERTAETGQLLVWLWPVADSGYHLIHANIVPLASDGSHPLDQVTRRWICEECLRQPSTPPQLVEALRKRGWRGGTGSIDSTAKWLAREGWLSKGGTVSIPGKKPSTIWAFAGSVDELRLARRRNALGRLDAGDELLLVPVGALGAVAPSLAHPASPFLWGLRTGNSSAAFIAVLDSAVPDGARDALVAKVAPTGARRIRITSMLNAEALQEYGREIESG